jgi:hypothetical protein
MKSFTAVFGVVEWNTDHQKVRVLRVKTDFEDQVCLQTLQETVQRQPHPPQRTFAKVSNASEDCFEGEEPNQQSIYAIQTSDNTFTNSHQFSSFVERRKDRIRSPSRNVLFHGQAPFHNVRRSVHESVPA